MYQRVEIINLHSEVLDKESWIANKTINKVNEYYNRSKIVLGSIGGHWPYSNILTGKNENVIHCPTHSSITMNAGSFVSVVLRTKCEK